MPSTNAARSELPSRSSRAERTPGEKVLPGKAPRAAGPSGVETLGLRERKKARLRQEIIDTSIRLFRKRGYENTRVEDIVQILEISQPTFFRYFPSKDAVLREVGRRGFSCLQEHMATELSSNAGTAERLRRMFEGLAREVESDRPLWQAVVLSGAMDPVRSPEMRKQEQSTVSLLREILAEGQKRGELKKELPVAHLAQFMEGLYTTVVRRWAVDLPAPHNLIERVRSAVELFLSGAQA
ncbi:MAG TPA: TetR/AcrR family transcriptional regulator [Candidatus Acidoferrales bacterium]|nr:TetR/AcrR family transcriptional regulator [Candidatus Acidoferrales bacterium]